MTETVAVVALPDGSTAVTATVCGHGASCVGMTNRPSRSVSTGGPSPMLTMTPRSERPCRDASHGQGALVNGVSSASEGPVVSRVTVPATGGAISPQSLSCDIDTAQPSTGTSALVRMSGRGTRTNEPSRPASAPDGTGIRASDTSSPGSTLPPRNTSSVGRDRRPPVLELGRLGPDQHAGPGEAGHVGGMLAHRDPVDRRPRDRVGREVRRVARAQLREHEADRWPMPPRPGRTRRGRRRCKRPAERRIPVHRRGHQQLAVRADVEGRQRPGGQPECAGPERASVRRTPRSRAARAPRGSRRRRGPRARPAAPAGASLRPASPAARARPGSTAGREALSMPAWSRRSRPCAPGTRRPSRRPCPIACPLARTRRCGRRSRRGPRSAPRAWGRRRRQRQPSPTSGATGRAGRARARLVRAPRPGRHRRDRRRAAAPAGRSSCVSAGRRSWTRRGAGGQGVRTTPPDPRSSRSCRDLPPRT